HRGAFDDEVLERAQRRDGRRSNPDQTGRCGEDLLYPTLGGGGTGADGLLPSIERDQDSGGADATAQCKRNRGGATPGRASESAQGALSRFGDASAARRGEAAAERARGDAFVRSGIA